ncbi:MAG: CehA/McbA family metallohydrolase [Peptococcaceae bacterium]|nr:CehA/McbA family metallohydrolase [Peptococcaceae bacterium]
MKRKSRWLVFSFLLTVALFLSTQWLAPEAFAQAKAGDPWPRFVTVVQEGSDYHVKVSGTEFPQNPRIDIRRSSGDDAVKFSGDQLTKTIEAGLDVITFTITDEEEYAALRERINSMLMLWVRDQDTTQFNEVAIYFKATPNQFMVTYNSKANGGSTGTTTAAVNKGGMADLERQGEKENWTFVGWHTDPQAAEPLSSCPVTANVMLYAIYEETVTYNEPVLNPDGTVTVTAKYNNSNPSNDPLVATATLELLGDAQITNGQPQVVSVFVPAGGAPQTVSWTVQALSGSARIVFRSESNGVATEDKMGKVTSRRAGWISGDTHNHSSSKSGLGSNSEFDGAGTIAENFAAAKKSGMDFINITDHNVSKAWGLAQLEGPINGILPLWGNEYTRSDGRHIVFMNVNREWDYRYANGANGSQLLPQGAVDLFKEHTSGDGLAYVAHPYLELWSDPWGTTHSWTDDIAIDGLEVWNSFVRPDANANKQARRQWDTLNKAGRHLYGIADTDSHVAESLGTVYTTVLVDDYSVDGIIAGYKAGHMYGSNGPVIDFKVDGAMMGDDIGVPVGGRTVNVELSGSYMDNLAKVELLKNGEIIDTMIINNKTFSKTVPIFVQPGDFIRMEVTGAVSFRTPSPEKNKPPIETIPFAFSNPIFFFGEEPVLSELTAGQTLESGKSLTSHDDRLELTMRSDGNLVLTRKADKEELWASETSGNNGAYGKMQSDGNFVIYKGLTAIWATGTSGQGATKAVLQNDNKFVLCTNTDRAIWATSSQLRVGKELKGNEFLISPDNTLILRMQAADGNLVLKNLNGEVLWASGSYGNPGAYAKMLADGTLAIYNQHHNMIWNSETHNQEVTRAEMRNDRLSLHTGTGKAIWATSSQLMAGKMLMPGGTLTSPDGALILRMQTDGNLRLARISGNVTLWTSGTAGNNNAYATMQYDGNFVIYSENIPGVARQSLRATGTSNRTPAATRVVLQNDGNIVLRTNTYSVVWESNPTTCKTLAATLIDYDGTEPTTPPRTRSTEIPINDTNGTIILPTPNTYTGWNPRGWAYANDIAPKANVVSVSGEFILDKDETLYGLYEREVKLTYDTMDGQWISQAPQEQSVWQYVNSVNIGARTPGDVLFTVVEEKPARAGHDFEHWALNSPEGPAYNPGDSLPLNDNDTLFAVWKAVDPLLPNPQFVTVDDDYLITVYGTNFASDSWVDLYQAWGAPVTTFKGDQLNVSLSNEGGLDAISFSLASNAYAALRQKVDESLMLYVVTPASPTNLLRNEKPLTFQKVSFAACIKGLAPLNVFTADRDAVFAVVLQKAANANISVNWEITDYFGHPAGNGSKVIEAGQSMVTINTGSLVTGHYIITARVSGQDISENFAVVAAEKDRPLLNNSPFGMDTSISVYQPWCAWNPILVDDLARALRLSGISWVSQRMVWNDTKTTTAGKYKPCLEAFEKEGIKVLSDVSHMPTGAIKSNKAMPGDQLPDPRKAYDLAAEYGNEYKDLVSMWAIWNEQETNIETAFLEIGLGSGEGPDRYAATLKAMSIGFHDVMPDPLVSMGGLMHRGSFQPFHDTMFDNEIMGYSDIYNFHNHQPNANPAVPRGKMGKYDTLFDSYQFSFAKSVPHLQKRNELEQTLSGGSRIPAWLTEAGGGIPNSPGQNAVSPEGLGALNTYAKQQAQARYWVTSAAMSLSTGVDRHFWFTANPGEYETFQDYPDVYWSCFSPRVPVTNQVAPYAAYVAQSAMTKALGEAKYLGELKVGPGTDLPADAQGYVFRDGQDTILVLWAGNKSDVSLDLGQTQGTWTNIMGEEETVSVGDGIFRRQIGPDPMYLRVQGDIPAGMYTATPYVPATPVSRTLTQAQRIVLDQTFPVESRSHDVKSQGYIINKNESTEVEVTVYNFNDIPINGTVTGSVGGTNGYSVSGPQSVTIGPWSQVTRTFIVTATGTPSGIANLTFTGNFPGIGQATLSTAKVQSVLPLGELGTPDYQDTFDYSSDGLPGKWDLWPAGQQWKVANGKLVHDADAPAMFFAHHKAAGTGNAVNGIVSTRFKITDLVGNADHWGGLYVRRQGSGVGNGAWNTSYLVYVNHMGWVSAQKGLPGSAGDGFNGQMQGFTTPEITSSIVEQEIELAIAMEGNRFDVYVNGKWVVGFNDDDYLTGYVGPCALGVRIAFDDFKVYRR